VLSNELIRRCFSRKSTVGSGSPQGKGIAEIAEIGKSRFLPSVGMTILNGSLGVNRVSPLNLGIKREDRRSPESPTSHVIAVIGKAESSPSASSGSEMTILKERPLGLNRVSPLKLGMTRGGVQPSVLS